MPRSAHQQKKHSRETKSNLVSAIEDIASRVDWTEEYRNAMGEELLEEIALYCAAIADYERLHDDSLTKDLVPAWQLQSGVPQDSDGCFSVGRLQDIPPSHWQRD